jgi:butyrate kinase
MRQSFIRRSKQPIRLQGEVMSGPTILSINPGTTTTRCALYAVEGEVVVPVIEKTREHDDAAMAGFGSNLGVRYA